VFGVDDGVGGSDYGAQGPEDDEGVVENFTPCVHFVPEEDQVAEGGHDEGEEGAAGGPHQSHQLTKVRNLDDDEAC